MSDSDQTALAHDFEILLRYVAEQKVMLTPKQKFVPVRDVRNMMTDFRVKEPHEEKVGDRIYKKRHEMEYRRVYFLDLLALSGAFLTITRAGRLTKGRNWQKFFEAPVEGRAFYLFCTFRAGFHAANWFLHRGGGFGERLEEKWYGIWPHLAEWKDGRSIEWEAWAEKIIDEFGLYWTAPDQTSAKKNMIWGLQYCLIEPMEYFGILELEYRQGEYSQQLHRVRLNPIGIDYFKRLDFGSKVLRSAASWFSVN
jgi:hypothetical protein